MGGLPETPGLRPRQGDAKETDYIRKRHLSYTQKTPIIYAKETYHIRKRHLSYTQKTPIIYEKETYHIRKKRPTDIRAHLRLQG